MSPEMLTRPLPRTLSAGADRLGRRERALGLGGAGIAALLLLRLLHAPLEALHGAGSDYVSFATGSRILASGSRCLYCLSTQADAQAAVLGYRPGQSATGFPHIYANLPLAAWLLRPVAALPLWTGMAVFLLASAIAMLVSARLLETLLPRSMSPTFRTVLVIATVASMPGAMTLVLGQWGGFTLVAAVGALWALRSGRPLTAGLLLSVLLVKPQLVWLLLPLLLLASRWRVAAGFAIGGAVWLASGLLLIGPGQLAQMVSLVRARQSGESLYTAGLPALVGPLTGTGGVFIAAVVATLGVLALGWCCRARLRGAAPAVTVSLGICASVLCSPHVFSDDLLVMAVPIAVLAAARPRMAMAAALMVNAAFLADERIVNFGPRWVEALAVLALAGCLAHVAPAARGRLAPVASAG
jgi:hypothetical protein